MKISFWCAVAVMALFCSSCVWSINIPGSDVVGNGVVVEETRSLTGYSAIDNSGVFNVHVIQGGEFSFRVECEENLLPLLITRVEDSTLIIEMSENSVRQTKPSNMYITLTELHSLKNSGVGNMEVTDVSGSSIKVNNSGVGNLKMAVHYGQMECRNSGVGNVTITGSLKEFLLYNKGVGNVTAAEIEIETARVENSGVGNVKVRCAREISIYNHGVGNVRYMGDALIKDLVSEGVGSIKKSED